MRVAFGAALGKPHVAVGMDDAGVERFVESRHLLHASHRPADVGAFGSAGRTQAALANDGETRSRTSYHG